LLSFLQDGVTTKSDVEQKIDQKPTVWAGGRVWTLKIGKDSDGFYPYRPANGWAGVRYSLVLEFDQQDVLHRHGLVDVKAGP